jgi:hypothetical protein
MQGGGMKALLKREEVYTLTVGSRKLANLEAHSHWEGMTKLVGPAGEVLIVSGLKRGGSFGDTFDAVFGDIFGTGSESGVMIHMASPTLALSLRQAAEEAA